jgi:hypothetical protein
MRRRIIIVIIAIVLPIFVLSASIVSVMRVMSYGVTRD